jgi:hypothetical protein
MINYIKKFFPPEQIFFNIVKGAYILLFIICIPEMFERSRGELAAAFSETIAVVLHVLVFFVSIPILMSLYKSKDKPLLILISILAFQIVLYFYSSKMGVYVSGLLNPFLLLPPLITFIFINKNAQNFSRNLVMFLFIPFFIVGIDKIITLGFQLTCPYTTPKAEYNPIYLPLNFFHEKTVNGVSTLAPNITEITGYNRYDKSNMLNSGGKILLYHKCAWTEYKDKLIKTGNIILCVKDNRNYNSELTNNIVMSNIKIKRLNEDKTYNTIATLYYMRLTRIYIKWYLLYPKGGYCRYDNKFSPVGSTYKDYWRKLREDESSYNNYIIPKK